ncbi:DUF2599 domain-containing protein [Pseudomonas sp. IT-232MI5]|jgi:hypothetical protein|uniref:DUF2599 domain-containing protein n=1 Tax=Pseudomonas sp. IT-232MI5 TaxID=3026442 RepID=UPI0039E001BC
MTLFRTVSFLQAFALTGLGMATPSLQAASAPSAVAGESIIVIVERCNRYIERAHWFYRDYQWALSITPTPCARRTLESATPFIWDELSRDYSNSRYWRNTHGMRHQLICHLAIARDKPEWNLEPWRPDVGYAKTLAAGCNHVIPLPEPAP